MKVVFLIGSIGVGKYTVAKKLSEISNLKVFHNHLAVDLATSLFQFGSPEFVELRSSTWKKAFRLAATAKESFIFTFSPESSVKNDLLSELSKIIEQSGGQNYYIELEASHKTILQRLQSEDRKEFGKLRDPKVYEQLQDSGDLVFKEKPSLISKNFISINNDQLSAAETAFQINAFIN